MGAPSRPAMTDPIGQVRLLIAGRVRFARVAVGGMMIGMCTVLTTILDPAWPGLEAELVPNSRITVLPVSAATGRDSLFRLQVTTRSRLGALALHTGGLLVDDCWLRVLGGGGDSGLPSLAEANGLPGDERPPPALLVGYDVLGGRFEVNGADPGIVGRPGNPGDVCATSARTRCSGSPSAPATAAGCRGSPRAEPHSSTSRYAGRAGKRR